MQATSLAEPNLQVSALDETFLIYRKFRHAGTNSAGPNLQVSALDETFLYNRKFRHASHKFSRAEFASLGFRRDFFIMRKIPNIINLFIKNFFD